MCDQKGWDEVAGGVKKEEMMRKWEEKEGKEKGSSRQQVTIPRGCRSFPSTTYFLILLPKILNFLSRFYKTNDM